MTTQTLCRFKTNSDVVKVSTENYETQQVLERITSSRLFENVKVESTYKGSILKHSKLPHKLGLNGFAEAIHLAYDQHHGLALSPDHVFITILQGLAIHINQDSEKHCHVLGVGHLVSETKEKIDVRRDEFQLGSVDNDWQSVFLEIRDKVGEKVDKGIYNLLSPRFSTTTPLSSAIMSLTIMDAFKSFFEYSVSTMCGIPEVALMGTREDWELLRYHTVKLLSKFEGLGFWTPHLLPVLDLFVNSASGNPDVSFWSKIYKPEGGSGGPYIRGWINAFFPYTQTDAGFSKNSYVDWKSTTGPFSGLTYDKIPCGFTKTPFTWNYNGQKIEMSFVGGFFGVKVISEDFVCPNLSWAVTYENKHE